MGKDQEERSFSTGFFKSLTKAFKTPTNNDRSKFDVNNITHDSTKQALFNELRNGSLHTRAKAAEQIADIINEFDTFSVPDIWYCASDLISPNNHHIIRRSGLKLLGSCAGLQYDETSAYYIYFNDCLNNYYFTKDKSDTELDLFLSILKILTDNGSFVHHYQEPFKEHLALFFIDALTPNDVPKNQNLIFLLRFAIDSINGGTLETDNEETKTFNITKLLKLIIKISLKTSDRVILETCISFIDTITIHNSLPKEVFYETLEILCGSSVLDLHYYDLSTTVLLHLIEQNQFQVMYSTLNEIVKCFSDKNEKNFNASIGAIKVLGFLFPKFAFQMPIKDILESFNEIIQWNRQNILQAIIQFFYEVLQNDPVLAQIDIKSFDSEDLSVLSILQSVSTKINQSEEIELYKLTLVHLQNLAEDSKYPGSLQNLTTFFINNSKNLSTKNSLFVVKYFSIENFCSPVNQNWKNNTELILSTFFYDNSKDLTVRLTCIKLLKEVFESSLSTFKDNTELHSEILHNLLIPLATEDSTEVLQEITRSLVELSPVISEKLFQDVLDYYIIPGLQPNAKERRKSLVGSLAEKSDHKTYSQKTSIIILKSFVTVFTKTLVTNGAKASMIYQLLINVAKGALNKRDVDSLLIISRVLVRIRQSAGGSIYLTNPTDIEGLSAAFSRNLNVRKTKEQILSASTLDEKWTFPEEISYISDVDLDKQSNLVSIGNGSIEKLSLKPTIYIDEWLSLVIQILESCPHWEIYSFIYAHFCPQLSNIKLFESCGESIRRFRSLICDQLTLKLPPKMRIPDNITKQDLQVAIVRNFTPLISYCHMFSKQDEDQIINALLVGLSSWEKTAIPCIHILTVCCYEIPLSIKKYLSVILTKLQTRISSAFASAHILEFLLSLSYIPTLTSNFTVDEFKRAFGITFKLIQYSHDITERKENLHQGILEHGQELQAESAPSTENSEITPTVSIYLSILSYDVIANWFLNMKLKERRQLSSFITKNLILSQSNRGADIDHHNLAFIDLISRFTYSDLELKFSPINLQNFEQDAPVLSSRWIYGNGIISIQTHSETGESIISISRASGSTTFRVTPDESMVPFYTNQLHSKEDDAIFTENYMLLQLIVHADPDNDSLKPIPIPDEPSFTRSISNFDRIPVVEIHKIGLLYVAPNQTNETEIFSNTSGSRDYQNFLSKFAREIKLQGCKSFYVGGLDTENNADGEYAYGWNDKILQMIFHTTTLMPNNEDEIHFSSKKRHIGNNYVNIFFDESGIPFDFNIIKSQFNFLNIVIQPHSISFPNEKVSEDETQIKKYKVKVYRRAGVPALFATCHFKIVSEENLPTFVRTLALIADQFAQIWHSNGKYSSSWSSRMRQIFQIKEKAARAHEESRRNVLANDESSKSGAGQSFLEQLSSGNSDGLSRNPSIGFKSSTGYTFFDPDDNDIFKKLEFTSFTK